MKGFFLWTFYMLFVFLQLQEKLVLIQKFLVSSIVSIIIVSISC